ncbi:response regulator transcription factor [Lacipirellula limnantheis]|uniref:Response regulator protein TodT n=1 Tax=Lacipirellula limnantheis TaxID=2528024 RepID=A0A517TUM0_9BACT|nr:response regulator [Lacipirellula limnantheis]QDT72058.1 Response regulator protein TodT [Lacipirellula limnantheis]
MRLPVSLDVWVIDDDESILESLRAAFARAGWSSLALRSVHEAKQQLMRSVPGCVVADLRIGEDSGMDLIAHIHQAAWPAPAIVISGHLTPTLTVQAMRRGAVTVVEKPIRIEHLCEEVDLARARALEILKTLHHREAAREALDSLPQGHRDVLRELVECRPHKQIANRVDISLRTVEKRKKEIFERLNVGTFTELIRLLQIADGGVAAAELSFFKGA